MDKKYFLFVALFLICLNFLCWKEVFALSGRQYLLVDFLDVGQGDSAFVQTPEGHQILIDGGPDSTVLTKLAGLLPFWDKSLDVVILTHPERDHMAGLLDVLQKYKVKYFLWTGIVKNDAENKKLADILKNIQNMKVLIARSGQEIKAGNVSIDTLFPLESLAGKEIKNTSNDTCIVSKLIFGKISFLFTCDISSVAEKQIINFGENILSDVLKVAHHGSKYSTSDVFLAAVKPKVAVIEVGKNSYGHPTPEVLKRLENFGIKVERTDQHGDVKFISDGNNLKLLNN